MQIQLTQEMEAMVVGRMHAGGFASAEAVVEDALRRTSQTGAAPVKTQRSPAEWADFFKRADDEGGLEFELEHDTRLPEDRDLF